MPLTFWNFRDVCQDEARHIAAEQAAAKAAVEEAAAREAAEAQAAALVEGDGAAEEETPRQASAGSALSAEEEAAQGSHTECVLSIYNMLSLYQSSRRLLEKLQLSILILHPKHHCNIVNTNLNSQPSTLHPKHH